MFERAREPLSVGDAIAARRAVRSYTGARLPRDTVMRLLAAAVRAPTAVHQQPWAFVVVQDAAVLARISERAKPLFAAEAHRAGLDHGGHGLAAFMQPGFNIFYDAGTLIVICAPAHTHFGAADCWLAAENLMLAACAESLGTCVIGSAVAALNAPQTKVELHIPETDVAIAPIIVGVPRGDTPPSSRKDPVVLAWW